MPVPTTRLIGREREVEALRKQICRPEVRILVLTGAGGVGKTRLAVEAASAAEDTFEDGAWYVPLAPIHSVDLVIAAIAQALGVRELQGQTQYDGLVEHLRARHVLLVLDNFEQVVDAATQLSDLLTACPRMKLLVTSREVLHIYGEQEFPLAPLSLPEDSATVDSLRQSEAVRLFEERARAVDPHFALSSENAAVVAEICRRLDGLPLAIELAAARVRLLPPNAMLARLGRRLPLLVGSTRGVPDRQRTLRDAIDWSHSLLTDEEARVFRQLGVFVGGFSLESAQAIVGAEDEHQLMDAVQSLLNKSLLRLEPDAAGVSGEPRFGMLETLAEYALEKLEEHGESEQVLRRFTAYVIQLAEQADPHLFRRGSQDWLARLEQEHDNLRRALRWCLETRRIEAGFRLATALWWFWAPGGHVAEGRMVLEQLLGAASRPTRRRAGALHALGSLAFYQGDLIEARRIHEEELAIQRSLGDQPGVLAALESLALVDVRLGYPVQAREYLEEALRIGRELGGQSVLFTLINLSNVAHEEGDLVRARGMLEEAVAVLRAGEPIQNLSFALLNLGIVARDQGDISNAQAYLEESLAVAERIEQQHMAALCLVNLGSVAAEQGRLEEARSRFERGLHLLAQIGDRGASAAALERCAEVAVAQGQYARGLQLAGAAAAVRQTSGLLLLPRALQQFESRMEPARRALGATVAAEAWAAGMRMSLDEAVARAVERVAADPAPLTPRELEVAQLVALGLSNREIAQRLVISARTADNHLQHILNKLGLSSRVQLAAWVMERNRGPVA
jgi:predicted ATPase/DNA-binding NarL/FixJ family response regulator